MTKTWVAWNVNEHKVLLKTDMVINNKVYNVGAEDDELYQCKFKKPTLPKLRAEYSNLLSLIYQKSKPEFILSLENIILKEL